MPEALRAPKSEVPVGAPSGDKSRQRTNDGAAQRIEKLEENKDADCMIVEAKAGKKQRRRKRATVAPGQLGLYQPETPDVKLMTLMVKSHLSLHQRVRELEGILLDVGLGDSSLETFQALKSAAQTYDQTVKSEGKGHKRGPPAIYGYMALMKMLASTEGAGMATKQTAMKLAEEDTALAVEELCEKVMMCKTASCYDQSRKKLVMHIACPERRQTLKQGLTQLGLTFCLSKAPAGAMEDELEKFLQGLEAK